MLRIFAILTVMILWFSPSQAQNIELGQFLSSQCADCHAVNNGEEQKSATEIRGMKSNIMTDKILAFHGGETETSIMHMSAGFLDEFETKSLAAYLESVSP